MGTPLKEILYDMAGGPKPGRTFKAVIPGGSSVPIMTREEAEAALFDYEGIVEKGSMLGSAGMIVMDDTTDMVYQIWRLARFYAHESCAQCTQCREGTAWTTKILERILAGKGKQEDFQLLLDLSENMTGQDHLRAERLVRRAGGERHPEVPGRVRGVHRRGARAGDGGGVRLEVMHREGRTAVPSW